MTQIIWTFGKMCEIVPFTGIIALIVSIIFKRRGQKELAEFFWWITLVGAVVGMVVGYVLMALSRICSVRYDLYVNSFEGLFGYPANRVSQFLLSHSALKLTAFLDYELYGLLALVVLYAVSTKVGVPEAKDLFLRFLLSGALVVPFYLIFPVSGPDFALPNFPAIYTGPSHTITITSFPNCIPSEHFAMALLVLWGLRRWRWGVLVGITHIALTILATLGFGQHYATDLVLAVPYTWIILRFPISLNLFRTKIDWLLGSHRYPASLGNRHLDTRCPLP